MNRIFTDLKILSNERENSLVKNLTRQPLKEPRDVMPHTTAPIPQQNNCRISKPLKTCFRQCDTYIVLYIEFQYIKILFALL
jgi:hypothetical protein